MPGCDVEWYLVTKGLLIPRDQSRRTKVLMTPRLVPSAPMGWQPSTSSHHDGLLRPG